MKRYICRFFFKIISNIQVHVWVMVHCIIQLYPCTCTNTIKSFIIISSIKRRYMYTKSVGNFMNEHVHVLYRYVYIFKQNTVKRKL